MKTKSNPLWILLTAPLGLLPALNPQLSAAPLGTAFTYQGRLRDGGQPANGVYDLRFAIYDAATNGHVVTGPLTNAAIAVSNGLFTLSLDFGPGVFTGDARWLEIGVRTNGDLADFTLLTPRQPLTAAPYALQSLAAGVGALRGYGAGVLGASMVEYCVGETEFTCEYMALVPVALHEGHEVWMDANIQQGPVEVPMQIRIKKTPRLGVPGPGAYDVTMDLQVDEDEYELSVAPDHPVANLQDHTNYTGDLRLEAQLVSDELLLLRAGPGQIAVNIRLITTESTGFIHSAQVQPYRASDRVAQLDVGLQNAGSLRTTYIVTVTDCGPTVAPVVAQSITLDPSLTLRHTNTFYLRTSAAFSNTNRCTVRLRAPTGRIYQQRIVTFPAPTGGAVE